MAPVPILRLITWLPSGGIERKIAAVLPRLDRSRFEPHVCCIRERGPLADELERSGVPVHVIPFRGRMDPVGLWRLSGLVRRIGARIVHAHMYRSNTPATLLKLRNDGLSVIGHYHNVDTWETRRQRWLDGYLARRRDVNIAVSEAVRRDVLRTLGLPDSAVRTLHNGVDLDEFRPLPAADRRAVRLRLGADVPPDAPLSVCVARLVKAKNQALLIQAAAELRADVPDARHVLVGAGPDEARLRALAGELGVADRVIFLGRRDDVPALLAAADVAVLPSLREGFSNAVLEALACGVPVLASDVGGNAEVLDPGVNGYLCRVAPKGAPDETDPDDAPYGRDHGSTPHTDLQVNAGQFTRHLRRLLTDAPLRSRMGAAARASAEDFGIDRMVSDVERLYTELLTQ